MSTIVAKFGGSSLANAEQIRKAAEILKADPSRRYMVVSAPGKREDGDAKVTDLLYQCQELAAKGRNFDAPLERVAQRFAGIVRGLDLDFDLVAEIDALRARLLSDPDRDYVASRGEYLNAKIIAAWMGWAFVEPLEVIFFKENGQLDGERTYAALAERPSGLERAVIPGFYGAAPDGRARTFSRGGSDITGAIVARATQARLYENWTDVSGLLSADPRVVDAPRVIDSITYTELRELSYTGASVMHEEAIFPVRATGIPINIRNTNRPQDPGTMIVPELRGGIRRRVITGIAGRKGFSAIVIEKSMMNGEVGFGAKLLGIIARNGLSFEHCPTGIDTMSVIVSTEQLDACRDQVLSEIRQELDPEIVSVHDELAMIAVVGQGMVYARGVVALVFNALAEANVNVRMIDQGSGGMNVILGVDEADYETAMRAIYARS